MARKRATSRTTVPSNDPAAAERAKAFPHLVIRLMPAVGTSVAIEWTTDPLGQGFVAGNRVLRVLDPEGTAAADGAGDGAVTPARRASVVEVAQVASTRVRLKMCVVFGPEDCVYLAPGEVAAPAEKAPEIAVNLYDAVHGPRLRGDDH